MRSFYFSFFVTLLICSIKDNKSLSLNDTKENTTNQTYNQNRTDQTISSQDNKINQNSNPTNQTNNSQILTTVKLNDCQVAFCDICDSTDIGFCVQCTPYYELDSYGQCQKCLPGMYYDYGQLLCLNCYRSCQVCTGPNEEDCIVSPPGYVKQVTLNQLIGIDNHYFNCETPNCQSCPTSKKCESCLPGFGKTYKEDCQLCLVENCNNCDFNIGYCLACNIGYYYDLTQGICLKTDMMCDQGEFKFFNQESNQYICQSCTPGCSYCDDNKHCQQCQDGFFRIVDVNGGAFCVPCATQCQSCLINANVCTSCDDPNAFLFDGNCIYQCPAGYYEDKIEQICKKCDFGCDRCTGPEDCQSCSLPAIFQLVNGTCQRRCPSGQFEYYPVLSYLYDNKYNLTINVLVQQIIKRFSNLDFVFPFNDFQCQNCQTSCQECLLFDSFCIECQNGKKLSTANKTCLSDCDEGFYRTVSPFYPGEVCLPCQSYLCKNCTAYKCLECYEPYKLQDGKCHYPLFQYLQQDQVCPTDKPDQLGVYCTFQCPFGMNHQDNSTKNCFCDDTCSHCTLDSSKYQTNCLSCYNTTLKVLDYKCVEQCPQDYYEIKNVDIYDQRMFKDQMSGQCVKKCPQGYVVYIGDFIPFIRRKCLRSCPYGTREINAGYCIDVVCPKGYFLNTSISIFNQLNSTNFNNNSDEQNQSIQNNSTNSNNLKTNRILQDTNNQTHGTITTKQNKTNLISKLKTIQKIACQPCPQYCKECTQFECLTCVAETFLRNNLCVPQCNIDEYLTHDGICVECIYDCVACKQGKILYDGTCYQPSYPFLGEKFSTDTFKIRSFYTANGSQIGLLSPNSLFDIWWIIEQPPGWDQNLTLNKLDLTFELYNATTLKKISNFTESSKDVPKIVKATQTAKIAYSFDEGVFDFDQILLTNCTIGITENYWDGQQKNVSVNIITLAYLAPAPQGVFNVNHIDNNTFSLYLDGFNPIFSLTPKQYFDEYYKNYQYNDQIQENLRNLLYKPYNIQIFAQRLFANNTPIQGSETLLYEKNNIWQPFTNFTYQFTYQAPNDNSYRFIAILSSPWFDPQIFISNPTQSDQNNLTTLSIKQKKLRYENQLINQDQSQTIEKNSLLQELLQFTKKNNIYQLSIYGSQL